LLLTTCIPSIGVNYGEKNVDNPVKMTTESTSPSDSSVEKTDKTKTSTSDSREEIIYANLSADGTVQNLYAVNLLHASEAPNSSSTTVRDYGAYSNVSNLTNTEKLTLTGDEISFTASVEDFYYQADLTSKELPWNIQISFTLDGKKIDPQALAGKSGHLEMTILQEPKVGTTAERMKVFSDHYMLQTTVTLDRLRCRNITAPSAQIAALGTNNILTFVTMPGKSQKITYSCDVIGFEMDGISIAAVPFSLSLGDSEADIEKLQTGTTEITDASAEIRDALNTVVSELDRAGLQNTDMGLENLDLSQLLALPQQLHSIADGIDQVASGAAVLSQNYTMAFGALDSAMSVGMPDGTIVIDPNDIADALYAALTSVPAILPTLDKLVAAYSYYGTASTAKGTYDTVRPAFSAADSALPQFASSLTQISAGLRSMATQLSIAFNDAGIQSLPEKTAALQAQLTTQLSQLQSGLNELAAGYNEFYNGLIEYTDGITEFTDLLAEKEIPPTSFLSEKNQNTTSVQFVIKTAPIQIAEPSTEDTTTSQSTEKNEEATGFTGVWNRFVDLF
jgi:hypothetical protein